MSDTQEEDFVEVVVDIALQKEAEVPVPLEVEFVYTVEEAVGHVLSWPSYLVIRCSDLVIKFTHIKCSYTQGLIYIYL